ncbi:MAG: exopolyphosphatase, partial [Chitinophagales bacterium]
MKTKKIAAIDIGSNAMRLLINNVIEANGQTLFKKAAIIRVPIRLGTEAFTQQKISTATAKRLIHALSAYKHLMDAHGVETYKGCATSALREAKNGQEILDEARVRTGIRVKIISGKEEAAIIYATHFEKMLNPEKTYLYVDVGGGSTELTIFHKGKVVDSQSFKIGTIRLLNNIVTQEKWDELEQWLKNNIKSNEIDLIGSGGNINKVFKLSRQPSNTPLNKHYIDDYFQLVKAYSYEERITELDLNPDRADVIIPALEIFTTIMKWTNAERIFVPKIG